MAPSRSCTTLTAHLGTAVFRSLPGLERGLRDGVPTPSNGWAEPENWVLGKRPAGTNSTIQDEINIFKSKLIVLWGFNPLSNSEWRMGLQPAPGQGTGYPDHLY